MSHGHWARALGEARHDRDEGADRAATSTRDEDTRVAAVSTGRWTAIVSAMRVLTDAYNTGAKRIVLNLTEQSRPSAVTIAATGEGEPSITAVLEGTLICVQARDADGDRRISEIRLHPERDDAATAAYVLQHWMQRL
jgi:hypothetical protein